MSKSKLIAIMSAMALTPAIVAHAQEFGPDRVFLEADTLIDDQENGVMIAEGNVIARYEGRELTADKVIYNLQTLKVRAIGNVRIVDPDGTVRTAEEIEVDEKFSDGVATQFTAQLPQDAVVVARAATRTGDGSNALEYAIYTACPICEESDKSPTWTLRARRAVQNAETRMITYEGAILQVKGVPVFYLPYFAPPDPTSERRSGLLTPKPEISSKLGLVYEQPYYWAISESQDLTITPKLYSNVNSALDLAYRKRFYSGELNISGSMAYDYEFDSDGDRQFFNAANGRVVEDPDNFNGTLIPSEEKFRGHVFAEGLFAIDQTWKWGFGVENVTDDLYLRRYDIDGWNDPRGLLDTERNRLLNQIFAIGQTESFYTDVTAFHVQGLQANDDDGDFARVTPLAYADKVMDFGNLGMVSLTGSMAMLDRSEGDDTRRVSAIAEWENSYVAPAGLVFEPKLQARTDYYDYSIRMTNNTPGYEDSDTRTSGLAAATLRWPFIRRGADSTITVEPIVTIAYGESSVANGELPVEDSANFEYDLPVLFEADPFTEYDLFEQGGRIAAGFRATAAFDNGVRLRGTVGRRWREEADPYFVAGSNLAGTESDYVIGTGLDISNNFSFDTSMRVDDEFDVKRFEANTSMNWWRLRGRATYFNIDEDVSFSANADGTQGLYLVSIFEINDSLDLSYRVERNLETNQNRNQQVALRWSDDCSFFLVGYKQSGINDRGVGESEAIIFGFGFNTLGRVTNADFD